MKRAESTACFLSRMRGPGSWKNAVGKAGPNGMAGTITRGGIFILWDEFPPSEMIKGGGVFPFTVFGRAEQWIGWFLFEHIQSGYKYLTKLQRFNQGISSTIALRTHL